MLQKGVAVCSPGMLLQPDDCAGRLVLSDGEQLELR